MMRTINLAVIGAGRSGRVHAENIATRVRGGRLATVADVNGAAAKELAGRFPKTIARAHHLEVLDDPGTDGVIITR